MPPVSRALRLLLSLVGLCAALVSWAGPARADVLASTVRVGLTTSGDAPVDVVVDVDYVPLARQFTLGLPDVLDLAPGETLDTGATSVDLAGLKAASADVSDYLGARLHVVRGDLRCTPAAVGAPSVIEDGAVAAIRTTLTYTCAGSGRLRISSDVFSRTDAVTDNTVTHVAYTIDGVEGTTLLTSVQQVVDLPGGGAAAQLGRFLVLGLLAPWTPAVLLFLVAPLLGARGNRKAALAAAIFAGGAVAGIGLEAVFPDVVPGWLILALVILSIAVVAFERILVRAIPTHPTILGLAGIVHGVALARALAIDPHPSGTRVLSMIAYALAAVASLAIMFALYLVVRRAIDIVVRRVRPAAFDVPSPHPVVEQS